MVRVMRNLAVGMVCLLSACGSGDAGEARRGPAPLSSDTVQAHQPYLDEPASTADSAPYDFERPTARFELPGRLQEISGLTVLDEDHLGAIQDEKGTLFVLSIETGEVVEEKDFGKNGDYEGVERAGAHVYVLESDGNLTEITDWETKKPETNRFKTALSSRNDTEGLAYDEANERLLIACKEYPGDGLSLQRAIYAFDLETRRLSERPVVTLDLGEVNRGIRAAAGEQAGGFLRRLLPVGEFKPSALAVHPVSGELWVLSSVQKALVVLDPDGRLTHVYPLSEALFEQPEGLAFLPNGDAFIASEGQRGEGRLVRFAYHP